MADASRRSLKSATPDADKSSMKIEQCNWSRAGGTFSSHKNGDAHHETQMVLVFGNAELFRTEACFPKLRALYPKAHIFGCSSGGAIHDTRVLDDNLVSTAISFTSTVVKAAREPVPSFEDSYSAGQRLIRQFDPQGLSHILVLADGLKVNGSDLVDGIMSVLPAGVRVSGGFAADGDRLSKTYVWCNGEPEQATAAALGFYGDRLSIGVCATGGWGPFGPDRLITRSHKNVLYEFDGRPALELYKRYLGDHAAGLPATGLMFPLDLRVRDDSDRVLRSLLSIDEKEQSITFAGNVPEGAYARFMMGYVDELVDGTQRAARASWQQLNGMAPAFSLLVSCNARRSVLKQRVEEEVEAVREILSQGTPLAGFYSYGEIAPPETGGPSVLHNETMVVISFAES